MARDYAVHQRVHMHKYIFCIYMVLYLYILIIIHIRTILWFPWTLVYIATYFSLENVCVKAFSPTLTWLVSQSVVAESLAIAT